MEKARTQESGPFCLVVQWQRASARREFRYLMISTVTVVVWVMPPPVALMVMVWFPVVALLLALMVIVEVPLPGAAMEEGEKVTVSPLPWPDADKLIAELKLPETVVVIFEVPVLPLVTDKVVGEAERVKAGEDEEVTFSETVVVCVMPPPVALTVMV